MLVECNLLLVYFHQIAFKIILNCKWLYKNIELSILYCSIMVDSKEAATTSSILRYSTMCYLECQQTATATTSSSYWGYSTPAPDASSSHKPSMSVHNAGVEEPYIIDTSEDGVVKPTTATAPQCTAQTTIRLLTSTVASTSSSTSRKY